MGSSFSWLSEFGERYGRGLGMELPPEHSTLFGYRGAASGLLPVGMGRCEEGEGWKLVGSHSVGSAGGEASNKLPPGDLRHLFLERVEKTCC